MIIDWLFHQGPWIWCVLGLVLLVLEVLVPGAFFLWFGISAIIVGGLAFLVNLGWQYELLIFTLLSLGSLLIGRRMMASHAPEFGDPQLNHRGSRYVGREFVLSAPLSKGEGKLFIDDTVWRISGDDLPSGTTVRVTGVDGVRLLVVAV
ncbi:MAG: NfeD family protein [Rhodobacteraceae bacterium]|nr:NfeD family protein [Paracoccaceae bacterium]